MTGRAKLLMGDEADKTYLSVAIYRASRWVYFEILPDKTAAGTQGFLARLAAACPFQIEKILADNGKDKSTGGGFGRPQGGSGRGEPLGRGEQTNGRVERFNGRVALILKTTRFRIAAELPTAAATL